MGFDYRILVVDDEANIRSTSWEILGRRGYEIRTAADGFSALVELRRSLPDLIISDLRMPNMGGFEFLSIVRRRFPQIAVIAVSGEFHGSAPVGLLADAFFNKGEFTPDRLFKKIAALLEQSPLRPCMAKPEKAPVWVPKDDAKYIILTCTECLRSFSIPVDGFSNQPQQTECLHCLATVCYETRVGLPDKKAPTKARKRKRA